VTGESGERLAGQGPRGPRGKPGAEGLSRAVGRSLVFLFVLFLGGLDLFWSAHEATSTRRAIQAEYAGEQAMQKRAGAILGEKLCVTFARLGALKPPAGANAANPSRVYLQAQHDTLVQLGTDLGCTGVTR
jgi:hypothetical protein